MFSSRDFPQLTQDKYHQTSQKTPKYNCIAWAAGDDTKWWWPDRTNMYYWPANFPREDTITVFIEVFKGLGFELCDSDDLEADFEKIALYGMWGQVKHAARQLADGHWTSKLGQDIDISHYTADAISGPAYGVVCQLMKRPKS